MLYAGSIINEASCVGVHYGRVKRFSLKNEVPKISPRCTTPQGTLSQLKEVRHFVLGGRGHVKGHHAMFA